MSRDWRAYARHILDCGDKLRRIAERGDIATDDILYDATLRNLQTLAEATQNLPDTVKAAHPRIDWRNIAGFRNVLVHNYLGEIDAETLRLILKDDVAPLLEVVAHAIRAADIG